MKFDENFWTSKYDSKLTGWDVGYVSRPLKEYIDMLQDKNLKILIPGGGNSYEAEYLHNTGFNNVFVIDISKRPLENIKKRVPDFPENHLIHADFFKLEGQYDLILEQTFFCALNPELRTKYVDKMHQLLKNDGKLVGLLFNIPLNEDHPPFGGNEKEYRKLFEQKFDIEIMETAYNSIPARAGNELFIKMQKNK
ncbi:MAG: methyltransferase domain-containing protein [Bacteroidetes bacterium]|jgi:SAM-dependent methyltransferase|nr:methyltransferase domain-containing protein [Bacteroidota bacterium]